MPASFPQSHDIVRQHYVAGVVLTEVPLGERVEYEAVIVYHAGVIVALVVRVEGVSDPVPPLAAGCGFNIRV